MEREREREREEGERKRGRESERNREKAGRRWGRGGGWSQKKKYTAWPSHLLPVLDFEIASLEPCASIYQCRRLTLFSKQPLAHDMRADCFLVVVWMTTSRSKRHSTDIEDRQENIKGLSISSEKLTNAVSTRVETKWNLSVTPSFSLMRSSDGIA